jgi:hypothetical protein
VPTVPLRFLISLSRPPLTSPFCPKLKKATFIVADYPTSSSFIPAGTVFYPVNPPFLSLLIAPVLFMQITPGPQNGTGCPRSTIPSCTKAVFSQAFQA